MNKLTVEYQPFGWLPFQKKLDANIPTSWDDLTAKQLCTLVSLEQKKISEMFFLHQMTGIKVKILHRLSEFQIYSLSESFEFLAEGLPYHKFIIDRIHLPLGGFNHLILFAPQAKLKAVTFGQFIFADTYFANYQSGKNEDDLNKFIASLYLGKNEIFDEKLIQERFRYIGKLDKNICQAIALNYQLILEWLTLAYPLIFQKQTEILTSLNSLSKSQQTEIDDVENSNHKRDPASWIKVFQNFVGDDILHDDLWAAKPVNTIFAYITRKYKENARKK